MKTRNIIKGLWGMFPFRIIITLLARVFILGAVISYAESIANVSFTTRIILLLWVLMPLYSLVRDLYYGLWGCQTPTTFLWNKLEASRNKLNQTSKKRIIATKQRIWVEQNTEINIYNYWILKHLRKKEWMNINIEEEKNNG